MKCPVCGTESRVTKTLTGQEVTRARHCQRTQQGGCGALWMSREIVLKGTLVATNGQGWPAAAPNVLGDKGGLDLNSSLPSLRSDPEPTSAVSKQEKKKRGRKSSHDYTPEFEAFWDGCNDGGRGKGNKYPAFIAWVKFNLDPVSTAARWNLWMTTPQWGVHGRNKDVSSWLNARGWERDPTEFELRPRNGTAHDPRRGWAPPETDHPGGEIDLRSVK